MNELTFNGKNFTEFGAYIASSNFLTGAKKDVSMIAIPGRSGKLMQSNDRFENISLKVRLYITSNMASNMNAMRNFLASCKGYCEYSESHIPGEYRLASFQEQFDPDLYDATGGSVLLTFDAMPQRWQTTGDSWLSVDSGDTIHNPTLHDAKPIVRIYGTGTVQIGDASIVVTTAGSEYIDVDTDLFLAYEGNTNRGGNVQIVGNPVLKGNDTTGISFGNTITGVSIKPRWFTL